MSTKYQQQSLLMLNFPNLYRFSDFSLNFVLKRNSPSLSLSPFTDERNIFIESRLIYFIPFTIG